ncbi:MAG: flagellar protein FlgN [Alicyclobacillus herbarius]|uniref:flagellar protein FlgN n=1 Tax=Alicyclobacillus herbarius TaxID=122960 RepID=UPI00235266D0|nr:flagellar protein FlgN [Alicyclobacillus herbarius]MCL6633996.1 flagellar protein FlgN [Alicyclobacillus herbarius]
MDAVKRLLSVLERLLTEHQRLVRLTERQQQALIHFDTTNLESVVEEINRVVTRVHTLEAERRELEVELSRAYPQAAAPLTVTELARWLDAATAYRLQTVAAELREVMLRLRQLSAENERITQRSLGYIEKMFEWIRGSAAGPAYGPRVRSAGPGVTVAVNVQA